MKTKKLKFLILSLILISCNSSIDQSDDIDVIEILHALNNQEEIKISRFVNEIDYILPEETDITMLANPSVVVIDDYLIMQNSGFGAMAPVKLFDRNTGKFVRSIGKQGRGPEEFYLPSTLYNIYSKTLYAMGYNKDIKEYDLEGRFQGGFKLPVMIDEKVDPKFGTPGIYLSQYLKADLFVSNIVNFTGWDKRRIVLFNRDSIVKIFPNYLFWERENWRGGNSIGMNPCYFRWDNQLYFKDAFIDTVFQVTENSLIPRFVFNMGEYKPKPEIMKQSGNLIEILQKYLFTKNISENKDFLFFQLYNYTKTISGYYDISDKETHICQDDERGISGFIDDINGFMPIQPQAITLNNEIVAVLKPEDITKWLQDNPEEALRLYSKINWLKSYSLISNPIIVIAKCK